MSNMNNHSVECNCVNMIKSFRSIDLQLLLGTYGQNTEGGKSELIDRAIELLRTRPANINKIEYIAKIHLIYSSLQQDMLINGIMMRSSLQNQQQQQQLQQQLRQKLQLLLQQQQQQLQRQLQLLQQSRQQGQMIPSIGQIQNPPQRMYQPPQYPQQPIHITAGNYQTSGTSTIVSHQLRPSQQMSIVAQDALASGTTASENHSYTPSIETVAQIKYKKLPFYEVIDEVIKPTLLTGKDRCTLPNVPEGMKEATIKFKLSLKHANCVAENRNISKGKIEYHYQFQIRICQCIEPVPNESPDYMPLGLLIRAGREQCQLPPTPPQTRPGTESRRTARPIDCTENIKLSPIADNNITINWTPDGKNYVFALYLVKKLTADNLIQKLQDKGGRSSEETKNYIIKKLADVDPDLATTSFRFSLVCPIGKIKMKIPAKSIHCDHLQCFDASTFILMNEKRPTWLCPTCNEPCLYDNIQIENYFLEVLSSPTLKYNNKEIEILGDGTWRLYEEKETKNTSSASDKVKHIDSVKSDDEKCIEPNTEPTPESSRTQEPENLSSFIDLTLNDEEQ